MFPLGCLTRPEISAFERPTISDISEIRDKINVHNCPVTILNMISAKVSEQILIIGPGPWWTGHHLTPVKSGELWSVV